MNFNSSILGIILETTITFSVLLILARLLGKKQMSHATFFNYITGITIGSIAANMVTESNRPFIKEFVALVCWCILTVVIDFIGLKFPILRIILDGEPTIVIKGGKINRRALLLLRLNIDDLSMLLREQNIFSIKEVDYAILEPDGKLSVLKKISEQAVTKKDLKISSSMPLYLPSEIIVDGNVVGRNLRELNLTRHWLNSELKKQGINSFDEVLYAEIQSDGTLYVDRKKGVIE